MNYPSIFNDVLGPVMRGPSSSHCAAALRIGRLCHDLMDRKIVDVLVEFDPNGSLATTHQSQGSDMGFFGGLLGWDAFDERLMDVESFIQTKGINVSIKKTPLTNNHPNTYQITLSNSDEVRRITAISTGGGMIEVVAVDGFSVSMYGDFYETLIYTPDVAGIERYVRKNLDFETCIVLGRDGMQCLEIKSIEPIDEVLIREIRHFRQVNAVKVLQPVIPVLSRNNVQVPFITCEEMITYNTTRDLSLWELAVDYESKRGNIGKADVLHQMGEIHQIMRQAVDSGLKGTDYADRILGSQSVKYKAMMEDKKLLAGDALNRVVMYVSAIMEVKSSMGVIVAAPTAGSCGAMPGAVLAIGDSLGVGVDETIRALLASGIIGVFIAAHSTFAAEVGGCQAECGAGSTMAAAAIVQLAGGTLKQSLAAASMALQSALGMICDPIGNRVEAPCLNRNVMAATNALSCANMALSDYDHLIPLDQVIETMYEVGKSIPNTLRCTNLGGLSITKAAKEIEARLTQRQFYKSC